MSTHSRHGKGGGGGRSYRMGSQEHMGGQKKMPMREHMGNLADASMPDEKMHKVMHEFKMGSLRSSSGQKVTSRAQAVAIGMSESGQARKRGKGKRAAKGGGSMGPGMMRARTPMPMQLKTDTAYRRERAHGRTRGG